MPPDDYAHFIIACLVHDIGYVRGVLAGDGSEGFVIDASGRKVTLPPAEPQMQHCLPITWTAPSYT